MLLLHASPPGYLIDPYITMGNQSSSCGWFRLSGKRQVQIVSLDAGGDMCFLCLTVCKSRFFSLLSVNNDNTERYRGVWVVLFLG